VSSQIDQIATEAVRQGLRQLGYVEGQSVIIEPRWPANIGDRVPELVRELLALNVQVIVAERIREGRREARCRAFLC
jgi:putative ABC transport system substrate-binding protein